MDARRRERRRELVRNWILNLISPGLADAVASRTISADVAANRIRSSPWMRSLRAAACGMSVIDLLVRSFEAMAGCKTNDFLSGDLQAMDDAARLGCQAMNTISQCGIAGPASTVTMIGGITCSGVSMAADWYVCRNMKDFCYNAIQNTGPAPQFTAETGYSGDLHCCCNTRRDFTGAWSIGKEHECLDQGNTFRPGTCGAPVGDPRRTTGLPTDAASCAAWHANPPPPPVVQGSGGPIGASGMLPVPTVDKIAVPVE